MKKVFFLILVFTCISSNPSEYSLVTDSNLQAGNFTKCALDLINITNGTELSWLAESGKMLNDMGFQGTCEANSSTNYMVLKTIRKDLWYKMSLGICIDAQCTPDLLNYLVQGGSFPCEFQNQTSCNITAQVNIFLATASSLTGYDPQDYAFTVEYPTNHVLNSGGWIVSVLMTLLIIPTVLSCCIWLWREPKSRKARNTEETEAKETDTEIKYTVRGFGDVFNFKKNSSCLFDTEVTKTRPYLRTLDGVRFFLMFAMVVVTEYQLRIGFSMNFSNKDHWVEYLGDSSFQWLMGAHYITDIFFLIGGFAATNGLLHYFDETKTLGKTFTKAIVHKLFRFWPLYLLMTFFYWSVLPAFSNGSNTHIMDEYNSNCKNWWADLLTIGIYVHPNAQCMGWTWYLQADFHMWIILAAILLVSFKIKLTNFFMYVFLGFMGAMSYLLGAIMFFHERLKIETPLERADENMDYRQYFFQTSWGRAAPYFLGAMFGLYYYTFDSERKRFETNNRDLENLSNDNGSDVRSERASEELAPTKKQSFGYILFTGYFFPILGLLLIGSSWGLMADLLYNQRKQPDGNTFDEFRLRYLILINFGSRLIVCLGVLLICVPEVTRTTSPISLILGSKIWLQFSKIGLSFFFVYVMFIQYGICSEFNSQLYDNLILANYTLGDFYISIFIAVLLTLFFEIPFRKIGTLVNNNI